MIENKDADMYKRLVKLNGRIIKEIPANILTKQFLIDIVKEDWKIIREIPSAKRNKQLCMLALSGSPLALEYVPERWKTLEMCGQCFKLDKECFMYIPHSMKNEEMCLDAIKYSKVMIQKVPLKCLTEEICLELVGDANYRSLIQPEVFTHYNELCIEYMRHEGKYPPGFVPTYNQILEAFKRGAPSTLIRAVPEEKRTQELCALIVERSPEYLPLVPNNLVLSNLRYYYNIVKKNKQNIKYFSATTQPMIILQHLKEVILQK